MQRIGEISGKYVAALLGPMQTAANAVDDQEQKLRESLLIFTCALMNFAVMLWLAIYWLMGSHFSTNVPLTYQLISISSLIYYLKFRNFATFRFIQLGLFLFAPFIMQWSIGSSSTSSGVMLWALLAPLAAVGVAGWRESIPWFIAYIVLISMSGFFDYFVSVGDQGGIPSKTVGVFFALNFAAMSSILYFIVRYFVLETEKIKIQLRDKHLLLIEEQNKSELLLLNVMPSHVARRLKDKQKLIADGHDDVAVMFANLTNFTQIASHLRPEQIVDLLNSVFSGFDKLTEKYGLEKIKTMGDAYMAASGLTREPKGYVSNIADMAMEMREFVATHSGISSDKLALHIGIATGPVVAGVVGAKRFIYDLWGDTVNIASRLTDAATEGKILVDEVTYGRLRQHFLFEPPVTISVKGQGEVLAYSIISKYA